MSSIQKVRRDIHHKVAAGVDFMAQETARERKQRINATLAHWRSCGRAYVSVDHALKSSSRSRYLVGFYANATYSVQVYDKFEHAGITWLLIRRHDEGKDFPWYDLQHAKNSIVGEDRLAVEVFPPEAELVDDANIRHLWVYPRGHQLPFGLDVNS